MLGVVIGANNLAAALSLGAMGQRERRLRVVAVIGFFEFTIPLVGIWLGRRASNVIADQAGWIGSALLTALGVWALWSATRSSRENKEISDRVTTWKGLVLLALGLSIDNLIIGFSLGLGGTEPLLVAATISVFSMAFTWIGITSGSAARRGWERWAQIGAGVLLLGLAAASWAGVI